MIIRNTNEIMLTQQPSQIGTRMCCIVVSLILSRFILIVIIKESNKYLVVFLLFLFDMSINGLSLLLLSLIKQELA